MTPIFRKLGTAFAIVTALAVTGCADSGTPVTAADGPPVYNTSTTARINSLARFRNRPQVSANGARKWIGPEGGRLEYNGFAIEVPRGAVTRSTQFSIRLPVDPNGAEHVVGEFGPHNQQFRVPVAIELPLRNTTLEGATDRTIVWWNSNGWVDMGAAPTRDGLRLRTLTGHFSTYGTAAENRNGTLITGGG